MRKRIHTIIDLALIDQKTKYANSIIGFFWAFIKPFIIISLFIFVFEYGLRVNPSGEEDMFTLWLVAGMIPWFFFSESILIATNSIFEYSYLVKKMKFDIIIIPMIKIVSSFLIHIVFVILLLLFASVKGSFGVYFLGVLYYMFASLIVVTGITYLTSSLAVFLPDVKYIVELVMQLLFWITPVFWNYRDLDTSFNIVLKYNPFFYVIEGYRKILVDGEFALNLNESLLFWSQNLLVLMLGVFVFKKLRRHFVDLL